MHKLVALVGVGLALGLVLPSFGALAQGVSDVADTATSGSTVESASSSVDLEPGNTLLAIALGVSARDRDDENRTRAPLGAGPAGLGASDFDHLLSGAAAFERDPAAVEDLFGGVDFGDDALFESTGLGEPRFGGDLLSGEAALRAPGPA